MSTRNTHPWETHITGMHAANASMQEYIVHCWLYSYTQSFSYVYSYGTPMHTRMDQHTHIGQNINNRTVKVGREQGWGRESRFLGKGLGQDFE